jgi:hypothetical protein
MVLFLVVWIGPISCYLGTGPNEAGDLSEDIESELDRFDWPGDALEPEQPHPDAVEIRDAFLEDITEASEPEWPWEDWCPFSHGCMDGCCPECENGSALGTGGCWDTCEEYYNIEMDCTIICPDFTCDAGYGDWLAPGCIGIRDTVICGSSFGKNSFWYRAKLSLGQSLLPAAGMRVRVRGGR